MQEKGKTKNTIILALILLAIGVAMYFYATRDKEPDDLLIGVTAGMEITPVDDDLLAALRDLKKLRLDQEIFKNPVFISLVDFGQILAEQPKGRANPFAPLSSGEPVSTTTPRQ